jgi:hypothetical protein
VVDAARTPAASDAWRPRPELDPSVWLCFADPPAAHPASEELNAPVSPGGLASAIHAVAGRTDPGAALAGPQLRPLRAGAGGAHAPQLLTAAEALGVHAETQTADEASRHPSSPSPSGVLLQRADHPTPTAHARGAAALPATPSLQFVADALGELAALPPRPGDAPTLCDSVGALAGRVRDAADAQARRVASVVCNPWPFAVGAARAGRGALPCSGLVRAAHHRDNHSARPPLPPCQLTTRARTRAARGLARAAQEWH